MRAEALLRPLPPSPLTELTDERLGQVRVLLKRDDLLHPDLPGNKWRKLRHQLIDARRKQATRLLTFGGPYSNHVRAVAAAGRLFGFATIGVIRGEERPFNDVLAGAVQDGMTLHYVARSTYRRKTEPDVLAELYARFGDCYLIPEGGSAPAALAGCAELVAEIDRPFDVVVCPVGTGGTLAGLASGLAPDQRALGFAVLRGAEYLDDEVARLQRLALGRPLSNWRIDHRFHCGGFARRTPSLREFITDFQARHDVLLDWVYVAKAMFGLYHVIAGGEIHQGKTVVFVVTGPAERPTTETKRQISQ
jgi:1-aminocyclopropane-1-carboxylate deaminase/D-cysteine desulfhydrase-like pyridoxal-dependent ACC family enzyme